MMIVRDATEYLYVYDRARQQTHANLAERVIAMLPGRTTLLSTTPQRFERLTRRGAVRVEPLCGHDEVSAASALGASSIGEWLERRANAIAVVDGSDALAAVLARSSVPVVAIRSDALDALSVEDEVELARVIEVSIDPWRSGRTPGELTARIEATAEAVVDAIIEVGGGSAFDPSLAASAAE